MNNITKTKIEPNITIAKPNSKWSKTAEMALIIAMNENMSFNKLKELFPHRTEDALKKRAYKLGYSILNSTGVVSYIRKTYVVSQAERYPLLKKDSVYADLVLQYIYTLQQFKFLYIPDVYPAETIAFMHKVNQLLEKTINKLVLFVNMPTMEKNLNDLIHSLEMRLNHSLATLLQTHESHAEYLTAHIHCKEMKESLAHINNLWNIITKSSKDFTDEI